MPPVATSPDLAPPIPPVPVPAPAPSRTPCCRCHRLPEPPWRRRHFLLPRRHLRIRRPCRRRCPRSREGLGQSLPMVPIGHSLTRGHRVPCQRHGGRLDPRWTPESMPWNNGYSSSNVGLANSSAGSACLGHSTDRERTSRLPRVIRHFLWPAYRLPAGHQPRRRLTYRRLKVRALTPPRRLLRRTPFLLRPEYVFPTGHPTRRRSTDRRLRLATPHPSNDRPRSRPAFSRPGAPNRRRHTPANLLQ